MGEPKRNTLISATGSRKRRAGCCGCKAYDDTGGAGREACGLRRKMEVRGGKLGTAFHGGAEWCERPTTTREFVALMPTANGELTHD